MSKILYLLAFVFAALSHAALPLAQIDLSQQNNNIGKSISVYEDSEAKMDFTQIMDLPEDKFKPLNKEVDSQLFTESAFWYRFDVLNKQDTPVKRLIVFSITWLDNIKVHVKNENTPLSIYEGGDTLTYKHRTLDHIYPNFEHEFVPGYSRVYVQIKTRDPFVVPISIIDNLTFLKNEANRANYTGFIYGIITAMLLYNLVLYLSIRERYYAFYVLYLGFFLLMSASYNGYTFKWFFFDYPELQNWTGINIYLFPIAGLFFTKSFLNLKNHLPTLNKITNIFILLYFMIMAITFFMGYHYHIMFAIGLIVVYSLYIFFLAMYSLYHGNRSARFFLLASISGLIGFSITALTVMSLVPYHELGFNAVDYGMVIDTILLSLALADRMKITQEKKIIAEKEAKKAEESKKAKEEFLSNMSHEIRTPMNSILGFIQILQKHTTDEKSLSYLNIIHTNSQTLLHVINDILDFSKLEGGKLIIDKYPFNPHNELTQISKLFEIEAIGKSINFTSSIDANVPDCLDGDITRIRQIIFNFLSNAFKFTSENKNIFINIRYENKILYLSVKDEGIGISPEAQNKIFNAFEQAENSTTREFGGTGLGLSISSSLAKLMDGKITLESIVGKGSTFTLSLPLVTCQSNDALSINTNSQSDQLLNTKQLTGNILVVEDNKTNQLLISILLDEYGLEYTIANNGAEAVELFKTSKFDLILMDESMPNMTGVQALKKIRDYEHKHKLDATPVVALTANVMEEDRKRFMKAGMDDFLAKPIDNEELDRVLKRFL